MAKVIVSGSGVITRQSGEVLFFNIESEEIDPGCAEPIVNQIKKDFSGPNTARKNEVKKCR